MKKYLILLAFIPGFVFGQQSLKKNHFQVNLGLGFSNAGIPVYGGFDYGIHKDMTLGAEGAVRFFNKASFVSAIGNWNYHFNDLLNIESKFDLYAGVNAGFYLGLNNNTPAGFMGGLQIGGRYFFGPVFGVNFELGGNNVFGGGKLGVTLKM